MNMSATKLRLQYHGSKFWVIFWAIFFFPVALILLATAVSFEGNGKVYTFHYEGSRFWLGFWTIFFFPITFVLLLINGFTLTTAETSV